MAAINGFQAVLTPEQKAQFLAQSRKPDATSVITFMTKIDDENATRQQRGVSSRLFGVLESIRCFSDIVDTLVSSHPQIAALVWGSVKFVIHVYASCTDYQTLLIRSRLPIISPPSLKSSPNAFSVLGSTARDTQSIRLSSWIRHAYRNP